MADARGEVVVITGATAGVGRAVVREFAKRKAWIGLIARGEERLRAAKEEVEAQGGKALPLRVDVANADEVELAARRVENEFGPIDVWVNNAMTTVFAPLAEIRPEEYKRATEVTYLGCVYGTMAALKRMLARDRGVIVQVGSALAYRSIPLQAPYCGAKHAIVGFTDSLRCELIHCQSNIQLTVVHLPAMNTPQFSWCRTRLPRHPQPVPPIFEPEVAAQAICWAAHHKRREIFVGSPTVKAIYGQNVLPVCPTTISDEPDTILSKRPNGCPRIVPIIYSSQSLEITPHTVFSRSNPRISVSKPGPICIARPWL